VPDGSPVQYRSLPPTSGPHYPEPASWGEYTSQLQDGRFVHNLEHGGIAILYKCDDPAGCSTLRQQLSDVMKTLPQDKYQEVKVVLSPYQQMDHQVDLLAWGWIDELDAFDPAEIRKFYDAHVDKGPEDLA